MPELFLNGTVGYEITADRVRDFLASEKSQEITVVINSGGGYVTEGLEIYNTLMASGRKITTVISGIAASMASIIFLAGDERIAMAGTLFMIHKPSGISWGDADDFRKEAEVLDKMQEGFQDIYKDRTNIDDIESEINEETWYTVAEMKEKGITNSDRKIVFKVVDDDGETNPIDIPIIETEDKVEMARIDDLKAELEEQKKVNAELAEKAEEAKLEAELAELKATNAAMQTTETQTEEVETETVEDDEVAEVIEKETKVSKQTEVIETKNAVAETTNKNDLPAFMQATSKY